MTTPNLVSDKSKDTDPDVISMSSDAEKHLHQLAKWFQGAKTKPSEKNISKCDDPKWVFELQPLLKDLKLLKETYLYVLCRLSGFQIIEKDPGYDNIMIPLSNELTINGTCLQPGKYMRLTSSHPVDAEVDFLLVLVPEETTIQ